MLHRKIRRTAEFMGILLLLIVALLTWWRGGV
jgi:hypothetical protein